MKGLVKQKLLKSRKSNVKHEHKFIELAVLTKKSQIEISPFHFCFLKFELARDWFLVLLCYHFFIVEMTFSLGLFTHLIAFSTCKSYSSKPMVRGTVIIGFEVSFLDNSPSGTINFFWLRSCSIYFKYDFQSLFFDDCEIPLYRLPWTMSIKFRVNHHRIFPFTSQKAFQNCFHSDQFPQNCSTHLIQSFSHVVFLLLQPVENILWKRLSWDRKFEWTSSLNQVSKGRCWAPSKYLHFFDSVFLFPY